MANLTSSLPGSLLTSAPTWLGGSGNATFFSTEKGLSWVPIVVIDTVDLVGIAVASVNWSYLAGRVTLLASIILSTGIAYLLSLAVYRIFFHPLAKYPGPFWAKVSTLYGAWHAWRGDLHIDMWHCHEKYGDYVRYGPNRLLVNTADGLKDIYGSTKQIQKSAGYNSMVHRVPNTFTEINRAVHERKRRIVAHGFSDAALRSYEPRIMECISQFKDVLLESKKPGKEWTTPQNMSDLAGNFAFDVMTSLIYGMSYNLQTSEEHRYIVPTIAGLNVRTGVLSQDPQLAWGKLDRPFFKEAMICRKLFLRFVYKLMKDRMAAEDITGDAFSILLKAKDPITGSKLDMPQLSAESVNLIVAGSDTTATSISVTMFYLSRYPDCYARAAEEIRSVFKDASEVKLGPKLNSCEYMKACITEALRMSPPVGSALWREVIGGGHNIDGEFLPSGVEVGTGIYSIHHNPNYYEEPFEFKPERWLAAKDSPDSTSPARAAYNPFSIGMRGCIGKALAMNELMLFFASLFTMVDFRTAHCQDARLGEGNPDAEYGRHRLFEYQMQDYLIGCRNGPMLEFRFREPVEA
ncbi:Cytochrome P450 monooxygenase AKT7 [Exophiala dermatitidis]